MAKELPMSDAKLTDTAEEYDTPFYIYSETGIRENARDFLDAFEVLPGFTEFFAVKALPNPSILEILHEEGLGADCSSLAELELVDQIGFAGAEVMFTSNDTPLEAYERAAELEAIINLDDTGHIELFRSNVGIPDTLCFRYNPGPRVQGNAIIGEPAEAKFGSTADQLLTAYDKLQEDVDSFGLHAMIVSNELDEEVLIRNAEMLFDFTEEILERTGVAVDFINLGGGIGIPYMPEEEAVSYERVARGVKDAYDELSIDPDVYMECGRAITGPYGVLVTEVRHVKETYKQFAGVDACMADLMRPGIYGAYHHITALGNDGERTEYDVVGSLCENNDKFAVDRELPALERGDLLAIHDAGAHARSMGFNYNGKLRPKELLLRKDDSIETIRREETLADYFATLDS